MSDRKAALKLVCNALHDAFGNVIMVCKTFADIDSIDGVKRTTDTETRITSILR